MRVGASPYATGGGGVVLEHRFGAVLISHVITGAPIPGLGDDVTPTRIRFQASLFSPVDDIHVTGIASNGSEHRLVVGVRRQPQLVASEDSSVKLVASYLSVVVQQWPLVKSGAWRLGLAVMPSCAPALQLRELAGIAGAALDDADFRARMKEPGKTSRPVRERLGELDKIITKVVADGFDAQGVPRSELAWRFLNKLHLFELRLEGADRSDRTHAVERLMQATSTKTLQSASNLFARIAEEVGSYAPVGGEVDFAKLAADLSDVLDIQLPLESSEETNARQAEATRYRADALMRGPLKAAGLERELDAAVLAAAGPDPVVATAAFERIAQRLEERGFRGHALLIRQRSAQELENGGHPQAAVIVLTRLLEYLVAQGAEHETLAVRGRLGRLVSTDTETDDAAKVALTLYFTLQHPLDDLTDLATLVDKLVEEGAPTALLYATVFAESALASEQVDLITERAETLRAVADQTGDEFTKTRLNLAIADATGQWNGIVAARRFLTPGTGALVRARRARYLTLAGKPDEAETQWWEAIEAGALNDLAVDTAAWLYAVRYSNVQYRPPAAGFETHPLAQAMSISGGRNLIPAHRDHYTSALTALHEGKLAAACSDARRALRHAVASGHLQDEMAAAQLLADVYAASGEHARAVYLMARVGATDKVEALLKECGDHYVDLTAALDSPQPWRRAAAYKAIAVQADLVSDEQVDQIVARALEEFFNGEAGRTQQGWTLPQVWHHALAAAAALIERATPTRVQHALLLLGPLVERGPDQYRHSDVAHIQMLAGVLRRHDEYGPQAAQQLTELLRQGGPVAQQVPELATEAIQGSAALFRDGLREQALTDLWAAQLLTIVGEDLSADAPVVTSSYTAIITLPQATPGLFPLGLLTSLAILVRHCPESEREAAASALVNRVRDKQQSAINRGEAIDALTNLSGALSPQTRTELFRLAVECARGEHDGSALDDLTGASHPLSFVRIILGHASLVVPGIRLAAATSASDGDARAVEELAMPLLNGPGPEEAAAASQALARLGSHPAALSAAHLAAHPHPSVRRLAAVRWSAQTLRDPQTGTKLATDPDYRVRRELAIAIAPVPAQDDDASLAAVRATLAADHRYCVRRATAPAA